MGWVGLIDGLTDEQLAVATAGPGEHLLVTAGPGTGKTHTLIARIGHLVEEHDVHPGGILALSFSRAAVGELRRRLRATGRDAGRVAPVTFDSFATRVLAEVDPDGTWTTKSFDGRIDAAVGRIGEIGDFLADIEHVCVDELQDLVGIRMRFVRALLERLDVGFTLLGDPAQGIYDFSLAEDQTPAEHGAPALYYWLREAYPDLRDEALTFNHRARTDLALTAAALNEDVVSSPAAAAEKLFRLLEGAPRLPSVGSLRNVDDGVRTAVLCRNNGQALWISRHLRAERVPHLLQRGATNRSVAPWIAGLVAARGGGVVNRSSFESTLDALPGECPDPDDVWPALRRVARDDMGGIDISRLANRMRQGNVPDELHVHRAAPITVSTVHRAKGLEFDRVVIVDEGWDRPFDDEDARTLYVAMTRTIESLVTVDLPDRNGRLESNRATDRWVHTGWKYWQRRGIEIRPDDVDTRQPAGPFVLKEDAPAIQRILAEDVKVDDDVELRFVKPRIGSPGATYSVVWNDQVIGMTTEEFGADLVGVLKAASQWDYPKRISELSVDAVRSVAGDPMLGEQMGLGPGGVWLAPSLVGMGKFEWRT